MGDGGEGGLLPFLEDLGEGDVLGEVLEICLLYVFLVSAVATDEGFFGGGGDEGFEAK